MKLNLDRQFINLDGRPTPERMDDVLANILTLTRTIRPAQTVAWAISLINDGEIEIDVSDLNFISEIIRNSPHITDLAKIQLLDEVKKLGGVKLENSSIYKNNRSC